MLRKGLVLAIALLLIPLLRSLFFIGDISESNMKQVVVGMTEREIEALLKARAGDYCGDVGILVLSDNIQTTEGVVKDWLGPNFGIRVWFDNDARAINVGHGDVAHFVVDGNELNGSYVQRWVSTIARILR